MRRGRLSTGTLGLVAVAAALALASSVSAASGTHHATTATGLDAAKAFVAQAMKPPAWKGPTTKVDIAKAKGKSVFFVNLTDQIPALHLWGDVMERELKLAGVKVERCDGKGAPNTITSCLERGLAVKPDVIVAEALDTAFIKSYIDRANKQGTKVVTAQTGVPGIPKGTGAVAEVTFDYGLVGKMLAAWQAVDSKCQSAPQIITTTSSRQPSAAEVSGMQAALKQYCPNEKQYGVQNVLIPDWATKLPTLTRSLLLANSKLSYLLPLYDGMTIYMNPTVAQMHLNRDVKIAAFNATPVVMQTELAKKSPLAADVGGPNEWYAVALADQVLRVLAGQAPVASENVPLRLFDRTNVKTLNLKADERTWYLPVNPVCNYHKLWGLPC